MGYRKRYRVYLAAAILLFSWQLAIASVLSVHDEC